MVLQLENYHVVKDKTSANFYVQENHVKTQLGKNSHQVRRFNRQNKRKEIDTFQNLNESRFEPIDKSPKSLSNVKKVTGLNFYGYKERTELFPETDQATFYEPNKEYTMRGLKHSALPWRRMTQRPVVNSK